MIIRSALCALLLGSAAGSLPARAETLATPETGTPHARLFAQLGVAAPPEFVAQAAIGRLRQDLLRFPPVAKLARDKPAVFERAIAAAHGVALADARARIAEFRSQGAQVFASVLAPDEAQVLVDFYDTPARRRLIASMGAVLRDNFRVVDDPSDLRAQIQRNAAQTRREVVEAMPPEDYEALAAVLASKPGLVEKMAQLRGALVGVHERVFVRAMAPQQTARITAALNAVLKPHGITLG